MEKNTNMHNADELCLKYILNELDPSEVLLVEQAMKEDENVLIEIESLRATLRKLDKLPESTPPEHVRNQILKTASEHAANRSLISFAGLGQSSGIAYISVAAVLLISISIGLYSYSTETSIFQTPQMTEATTATASENTAVTNISASTGNTLPSLSFTSSPQNAGKSVQPWIDQQNVLRINVTNSTSGLVISSPEAEIGYPSTRLTPIERQPDSFGTGIRDLQLTRTQY